MAFTYVEGKTPMMSTSLYTIGKQLAALGHMASKYITCFYDANYYSAVKKFQKAHGFQVNGVLTDEVIGSIKEVYEAFLQGNEAVENGAVTTTVAAERTDTFFGAHRKELLRQNNNDIRIIIGEQKQHVKLLKDVHLRSKSVNFDASGQAISETYEFIAKDLIETTN